MQQTKLEWFNHLSPLLPENYFFQLSVKTTFSKLTPKSHSFLQDSGILLCLINQGMNLLSSIKKRSEKIFLTLLPAQIPTSCKQDWKNEIQLRAHHCWWKQSGFQKITENCSCFVTHLLNVKQGDTNTPEPVLFSLTFLFIKSKLFSDLQK